MSKKCAIVQPGKLGDIIHQVACINERIVKKLPEASHAASPHPEVFAPLTPLANYPSPTMKPRVRGVGGRLG